MLPLNTTTEILTLAEARRRLDEGVRDLVGDMMLVAAALSDARTEYGGIDDDLDEARDEELAGEADLGDEARAGAQRELEALELRMHAIVAELNEYGAVVKDPVRGLIDFYGWHEGDMVFLCWLHGERTIEHWHGIESGFAGRQPIGDDAED